MITERPFRNVTDNHALLRERRSPFAETIIRIAPKIRELRAVRKQHNRAGYMRQIEASNQGIVDPKLTTLTGAHRARSRVVYKKFDRLNAQISPGISFDERA